MRALRYSAVGAIGPLLLLLPVAYASAQSLSIESISPGTSVTVDGRITFTIFASNFSPLSYHISDSFPNSSVSVNDITGVGNFSWEPTPSDVGTHVLSINANDSSGDSATTTQTIVVEPAPSISVSALSPGSAIMPGQKLTFSVSASGFTDPSYTVSDSFSQSSVTDSDIDASGDFSWTPADVSQDGEHTINVYVYDSLGHDASLNVPVLVGPGPTLSIQSLSPGDSVPPYQPLSFIVNASNFSPNSFSVTDTFPNSSVSNGDINSTGSFYWVPQQSDVGVHTLTITGEVGVYGQSATTSQTITVGATTSTPLASSNTASSSALSTLQAELAQLQSQMTAQSNTTTPPPTTSGATFTTPLYSGMQGPDVTELQTVLSGLGFFSGVPNGYFGPLTVGAVEKFQSAHGIQALGVVGPATRTALNALSPSSSSSQTASTSAAATGGYMFQNPITFGESGTDVLELQERLKTLGFFSGEPTGYFGDATLEALIQFQIEKGIAPVDQLGSATRAALNQ